ncbi:hypothetical protein EKG35_13290 [Lysinibacillus telephonicus]|uniref:Uncharacterized protein n=1 Tax=Lysinibacillus telephonicus TaxID=1714840 RepID=A0A431UNW3_9BACI|nr:hypothetical protein EKG35_13290 [Lysinibacillus telephonicus]
MEDGDSDANIAHYVLHKLRLLPSQYLNLPRLEKAFVIASIQVKIEAEKKARKEAERKGKGRKRR